MKYIKKYLFTGLLVWIPIGVTYWVIKFVINLIDQLIPQPSQYTNVNIPGIGLLIAILVLLFTGMIATNFIGQSIIKFWDKIFSNIPIVKSIYKGVKQVSDTLLSTNTNAFRQPILVWFPNTNTYVIGFITGVPSKRILESITDNSEFINVYIPTTPNPTSGYFLIVKKSNTTILNITVEEALKYVISMGAIDLYK